MFRSMLFDILLYRIDTVTIYWYTRSRIRTYVNHSSPYVEGTATEPEGYVENAASNKERHIRNNNSQDQCFNL
jgi:hypothetical protein